MALTPSIVASSGATRAVRRHPNLKPISNDERRVQILDAEINRRGVRADRELATAARDTQLPVRKLKGDQDEGRDGGDTMSVSKLPMMPSEDAA